MAKANVLEYFDNLIIEQQKRVAKIKVDSKNTLENKHIKKIAVVAGDGIGPVIISVAYDVLSFLLADEIKNGDIVLDKIDGLTLEEREKTGQSVPEGILQKLRESQYILKGPTTTPKGGSMKSANVTLRQELDLFSNIRPISIPEKNIDWTFFRENTEGEYALGSKGIKLDDMAIDFKVTTVEGTRRIAEAAFDFARKNGKKRVTIVTKANILKATDGLFSQIAWETSERYKDIVVDEEYVDILAANLINPKKAASYEVFLLPNLYGDIITDLAAQLQGGVGTAGSGNVGKKYAMFEAIHGSALDLVKAGREKYANPTSILRAAIMLLNYMGLIEHARRLEQALELYIKKLDAYNDVAAEEYSKEIIKLLK